MILEKLNDGFVNLYKKGIFTRCFEHSAVLLGEITGYKVYANIDKKTGFVFLELGFPENMESEILKKLGNKGYFLRMCDKNGDVEETIGNKRLEKDENNLKKIKQNLIQF